MLFQLSVRRFSLSLSLSMQSPQAEQQLAPPHRLLKDPPGIEIEGWRVTARRAPILDTVELERLEDDLKLPAIPEMVFGRSWLELCHLATGAGLRFQPADALREWAEARSRAPVRVAYSEQWRRGAQAGIDEVGATEQDYDWTFTTRYAGTRLGPLRTEAADELALPMERLRQREPILFYDELVLYEDELGDNGTAQLSVRVRVMPSCVYVLQTFFLRVDGVLSRLVETRVFQDLRAGASQPCLLREQLFKEAPASSLASLPAALLHSPQELSPHLPVRHRAFQRLLLDPALPAAPTTGPVIVESASAPSASVATASPAPSGT